MYREILYTVDDPVATITLNRPEFLNGWTQRMSAEFRHAVAQAEDDPAVVGIVITGAGRAFCAGADMGTLSTIRDGGRLEDDLSDLVVERSEPLPAEFDGEFTRLLAVKKPVIAAINGAIAGMAVPLALCCDLRFMAADAPLRTAFAQRGLIAGVGHQLVAAPSGRDGSRPRSVVFAPAGDGPGSGGHGTRQRRHAGGRGRGP